MVAAQHESGVSGMRVVVSNFGGDGHVRPFLPLLAALRDAGHELTVVTLDDSVTSFEAAGFDTVGVRPSRPRIDPMKVAALPASDRPAYVIESFLATAVDFARVILDEFSDRRPDLLLRENVGWGAWLAGARLDVPDATFEFSPAPVGVYQQWFGHLFNDARRAVGLPPEDDLESLDRWLTIVGAPPGWLEPEYLTPTTLLVQPPPDVAVGGVLPDWVHELGKDVPVVYLTMGTEFNRTPGLFPMLLEALGALDIDVIATIGRNLDADQVGPVPRNVHIEQFIPQALVLEHCDAVVGHGGYGTVMGALRNGLPIVCVPLASIDNILNAQRVARLGAGLEVTEAERSVDAIRRATAAVLSEASYRRAAQQVAHDLNELPPVESAVRLLEELATTRSPVVAEH